MSELTTAIKHLEKHDAKIAELVKAYSKIRRPIIKSSPNRYARELFASIVSQQLSTKVADVIWGRFSGLVKNPENPAIVKNFSAEQLRTVGLSNQKANYILAIANGVTDGTVKLDHLDELDDESVICELIKLKGVGRWTAEMFLIFTLARPDVFSVGDLGLKNAVNKLYNKEFSPNELTILSHSWSPFRSIVSLALWHSLDN